MSLIANVGSMDKVVRIIAGLALVAVAFWKLGGFATTSGIVATVVGAVFVLTALVNFCPLYKILGVGTAKR